MITINWFYMGWLYYLLGLSEPKFNDPNELVRDTDIDAFREGYTMALETTVREIIMKSKQFTIKSKL